MAITVGSIAAAIVGGLGEAAFRRGIGGSIVKQVMHATGALGIVTPGRELHRILSELGVPVSRNTVISIGRSVYNIQQGHRFSAEEVAQTIDRVPPMDHIIGVTWRQTEPYAYTMQMVPVNAAGERGEPIFVTTTYAERVSWRRALEDAEENFGNETFASSGKRVIDEAEIDHYDFDPHIITYREG